jgi:transposase
VGEKKGLRVREPALGAAGNSVVATCKAHGLDPWAYLRDVLERIPTHPNRRRAELLQRHWKALQVAAQP